MNFLKKLFSILLKTLDFGAKYGIIVLLGWVLTNAVIFQNEYISYYGDANQAMEREVTAAQLASYLESQKAQHEHDRQIIVARMIQSQEDWVVQCKIMRESYLEEKAKRAQARRDFYRTARELYHLIRTLEYLYPEVYKEAVPDIIKKLPKELQDFLIPIEELDVRPCPTGPTPPEPTKAE